MDVATFFLSKFLSKAEKRVSYVKLSCNASWYSCGYSYW